MRRHLYIAFMMTLLLMVGGKMNVSWAQTVNITFQVINKSGGVAVTTTTQTLTTGATLALPQMYRSPLLNDNEYKIYTAWDEEHNTFNDINKVTTVPGTSGTIYVTYDWFTGDELDARLADKGFKPNHSSYNIKQGDYFLYQWAWQNNPNAYYQKIGSGDLKGKTITDNILLWEYDFTDPYEILIKSVSRNEYLSVGDTYGDVRLYSLETAKTKLFWSFILVKDAVHDHYLLMVGNDNFDKNRSAKADQYGGYLVRDATTKARYVKKEDMTINDVDVETASTVIPTFNLTTNIGSKPLSVTLGEQSIKSTIEIPNALNRKYCNYTFKCRYGEDGHDYGENENNWVAITKYPALNLVDGNSQTITIKVEYTVTSPSGLFTSDEASPSWHSLWVNNTPVRRSEGNLITTGGIYGENDQKFALVGDPYEVKLINKGKGTSNYLGVPNGSAVGTNASFYTDATANKVVWEVITGSSYTDDEFALREYGTFSSPRYLGSNTPVAYQNTPTRMRIVDATLREVTYHIIRADGSEAIKSTVKQNEGVTFGYYNLPANISSPYLQDETLTFYSTTTYSAENVIRTLPSLGGGVDEGYNVYVKYTTEHVAEKPIRLNGKRVFNMAFNSGVNYASTTDGNTLNNVSSPPSGDLNSLPFYWLLKGEDPYAVQIQSMQADTKYINFTTPSTISLGTTGADTKFILKSLTVGADEKFTIQLMAATGSDASTAYYSLSYNNGFVLSKNTLGTSENISLSSSLPMVTYHVIDKQHKIVIEKTTTNDELEVPEEIRSPLVTKWRFWTRDAFVADDISASQTYNYNGTPTPLNNLAEATSNDKTDIYATYDEVGAISTAVQLQTVDPTVKQSTESDGNTTVARNYNSGYDKMYLLQFTGGESFYQENASDWFETEKTKAVYPYTCGDAGMYVYGEKDWSEQLSKGASTRTRWTWYLVSYHETAAFRNDPYHVKITSWQSSHSRKVGTTTTSYYSYFRTYYDAGAEKVITTNVTDDPLVTTYNAETNPHGNAAAVPTEYMVLGIAGNYKLLTVNVIAEGAVNEIDGSKRQVVHSFEQYWKTWETMMKKGEYSGFDANTEIPDDENGYNRDKIYSYDTWAYARPTSGEKAGGAKEYKYGTHYFQTIEMGENFHLVDVSFSPVLILLDNHGWEVMRRPIPMTSDTSEQEEAKRTSIKAFDSPMVKTYHWFTQASKLPGYHKYTPSNPGVTIYAKNASNKWNASGEKYIHTSTSLADLPYDHLLPSQGYGDDETSSSAKDANKQDLFVTYEVKEEYAKTYTSGTSEDDVDAAEYLLYQGGTGYAKATGATTLGHEDNSSNLATKVLDGNSNAGISNDVLWYVKPNFNIDKEMGYKYKGTDGAKEEAKTKDELEAEYVANTPSNCDYVFDEINGQNGFDPYNLQLQNKQYGTYLTTNAVSAALDINNDMTSTYDGDPGAITLATMNDDEDGVFTAVGHDAVTLKATNATFMAVQDANGNMRLMPRFDYHRVMTGITVVNSQAAAASANDRVNTQTADLIRPIIYKYHIIDNDGREALGCFGRLGEHEPDIPAHFKSPFAKDFKYYSSDQLSEEDAITSTFGEAGVLSTEQENDIYVRYSYDPTADTQGILKGKWFTMQLNEKDAKYDGGIKNVSKNASSNAWHWKMLKHPWSEPDPYAVQLFNRTQEDLPLSIINDNSTYDNHNVTAQTEGTENAYQRFAILSHEDGEYALALAGTNLYEHFYFLNGNAFSSSTAAVTKEEDGFKNTTGTYNNKVSQVILTDEVSHNYTYHVITNDGVLAISASTGAIAANDNTYAPSLPESAQSALLNTDDYLYYEKATGSGPYEVASETQMTSLMGIYSDVVYVRYNAYNASTTPYKVPNKKDVDGSGNVKKHAESNDIPLSLNASENRLYNIIWEKDNMMKATDSSIGCDASQPLGSGTNNEYVWQFDGSDPYAIKIKHHSGKYVDVASSALNAVPVSFMLLKKTGYDYGILQNTGTNNRLTSYGNATTTGDPTKFIIFALGTSGVVYHLVIGQSMSNIPIPHRENGVEGDNKSWQETDVESIPGTTQRNLNTYPIADVNAGNISLGGALEEPAAFSRPNCRYYFYVEGVYDSYTDASNNTLAEISPKYKGLKITHMGTNPILLDKIIKINVVYSFDTGLDTNAGEGFVTDVTDKYWYTFETADDNPYLAHYTYTDAKLKAETGRVTHCTNDYLWKPLGDPYGFRMYNRYVHKNGGNTTFVMSTTSNPADNADVIMAGDNANDKSIYDLLPGSRTGCFKVHPLIAGANVYLDNNDGAITLQENSTTDWTFGLEIPQVKPYFDRVGYVGGLTQEAYTAAGEELVTAIKNGTATPNQLIAAQVIIYDDTKIQQYASGYYRLHSMPGVTNISPVRYASGYLHKLELDVDKDGNESDAIPLHFYSKKGVNTKFGSLSTGFTSTHATRGDVPIPATEYDPSSIFHFDHASTPRIKTQGLEVIENKMTATADGGTQFTVEDIGGAVVTIRNGNRDNGNYLNYSQTGNIYDLKYALGELTDHTKWCMEPANSQGLRVGTNNGDDGYYYATFYAPFDVTIQDDNTNAFVCTTWNTNRLTPTDKGKNIPKESPVMIRTSNSTGYVTMKIPSEALTAYGGTNIFSGQYLEQLLTSGTVYTFGKVRTGLSHNSSTGEVTGTETIGSDVGIYLNANFNKESESFLAAWTRNNRYVLHNKIYYCSGSSGASAPQMDNAPDFVPVIFDGEEPGEEELQPDGGVQVVGDGCIYDLLGRKVATKDQVEDGTWRERLAPGIYILNGKKFKK